MKAVRMLLALAPFLGLGGSAIVVTTAVAAAAPGGHASSIFAAPMVAQAPVQIDGLIEYEHGWYQLRGDGVAVPYVWVWIPKPPPPPAAAPAPAAAAPAPPATPAATAPAAAPAGPRIGSAYRWTDDDGVTTWTNRRERIPERYRDQALLPGDGASSR